MIALWEETFTYENLGEGLKKAAAKWGKHTMKAGLTNLDLSVAAVGYYMQNIEQIIKTADGTSLNTKDIEIISLNAFGLILGTKKTLLEKNIDQLSSDIKTNIDNVVTDNGKIYDKYMRIELKKSEKVLEVLKKIEVIFKVLDYAGIREAVMSIAKLGYEASNDDRADFAGLCLYNIYGISQGYDTMLTGSDGKSGVLQNAKPKGTDKLFGDQNVLNPALTSVKGIKTTVSAILLQTEFDLYMYRHYEYLASNKSSLSNYLKDNKYLDGTKGRKQYNAIYAFNKKYAGTFEQFKKAL